MFSLRDLDTSIDPSSLERLGDVFGAGMGRIGRTRRRGEGGGMFRVGRRQNRFLGGCYSLLCYHLRRWGWFLSIETPLVLSLHCSFAARPRGLVQIWRDSLPDFYFACGLRSCSWPWATSLRNFGSSPFTGATIDPESMPSVRSSVRAAFLSILVSVGAWTSPSGVAFAHEMASRWRLTGSCTNGGLMILECG